MKWKFCNLDIFRLRSWSYLIFHYYRKMFAFVHKQCIQWPEPLPTWYQLFPNNGTSPQPTWLYCMIWTWLIGFLLQGFFCSFPFILISISKWFVIQHKVLFNVQEYDEITFTRSCKCFMMKDKWSHIWAAEENWAIIKS